MGLAIEIGVYADLMVHDHEGAKNLEESFLNLNQVLREHGIDEHKEPKSLTGVKSRAWCTSFPYSYLHYLRRFYAKTITQPDWSPVPVIEGEDPAKDPVVEEESLMFESHLLCHSDCEGFYLPLVFNEILFDQDERIAGGLLCSSYQLLSELIYIAPKLGIALVDTQLTNDEVERLNQLASSEKGFFRELSVWLALFEAANLSIEYKTAIIFC